MGEVYRARDTRLDRSVAIKVLPAHLSSNPDLRARFEREARAVSALNHPHVCVLYDVGHQDGTDFIVMELLDGETLLDRVKKGPLPLDQTLRYGLEIADALDKAHRTGVIHRDLKPGNVMLTKSGSKLMDFGLAKRGLGLEGSGGMSALPTRERPLTEAGSLLGTFQYMSPEQLEGRDADARADIWALGCVLYEMATSKRAFEGKSQASLISAIMKEDPQPIAQLQAMTPPALDRLVRVCLAKDPDDRWQSAHDVGQELKWIGDGVTQAPLTPGARVPTRRSEILAWALVGTLGLALAAVAVRRVPPAGQVVRFDVPAPDGTELQLNLAVSPDGSRVAFVAKGDNGLNRIYVRSLAAGRSEAVNGTDGAIEPFWSPDGRTVAFFADGKLKRADIGGDGSQTLCSAPETRGGAWGSDGTIIFGVGGAFGLFRVPSTGGTAEPLTTPDRAQGETSHRFPVFMPHSRQFLYLTIAGPRGWISLGSLDGRKAERLVDARSAPGYSGSGHLLFVRDGSLRAQALDLAGARLVGEPATVAQPVLASRNIWGRVPMSAGGDTLALRVGKPEDTQLTWFDRTGRELSRVGPVGMFGDPSLSPDERRLVFTHRLPDGDLLSTMDLATGSITRFTFAAETYSTPVWSPDGRSVAYGATQNGTFDVLLAPASGAGAPETLVHGQGASWPDTFSPDGRTLLYSRSDVKAQWDLWMVSLSADHTPRAFLSTEASEVHAAISPNGRWVAYAADNSGRSEVYVRSFPGAAGPWQVSTDGGDQAQWRRDGRELLYMGADRRLMAVAVDTSGLTFQASPPKSLFRARVQPPGLVSVRDDYVVSADGQRFLVNQLVEDPAKATITVIVNWASQLRK